MFIISSFKLEEIGILAERMRTGLDKLVEAEKSVNQLSKELAVKEKDLEVASKEADEVLHLFLFYRIIVSLSFCNM